MCAFEIALHKDSVMATAAIVKKPNSDFQTERTGDLKLNT
jgi:hypothetical protein